MAESTIISPAAREMVGAAQLAALVPLLPVRPLVLLDRRYRCGAWVRATAGLATDQWTDSLNVNETMSKLQVVGQAENSEHFC